MHSLNITVNVDQVSLDTAVDTVIGVDEDGDQYEAGVHTVGGLVAAQVVAQLVKDTRWPTMKDLVMEVRREEIRAAVRPAIDEALSRPIFKTNGFGERNGQETTLAELISEEARRYVTEPADRHRSSGETHLAKAVREAVGKAFSEEIADVVYRARQAVTAEIGSQVGQQVTEAVRKGLAAK